MPRLRDFVVLITASKMQVAMIDACKGTGLSPLGYVEAMKQFKAFIAEAEASP